MTAFGDEFEYPRAIINKIRQHGVTAKESCERPTFSGNNKNEQHGPESVIIVNIIRPFKRAMVPPSQQPEWQKYCPKLPDSLYDAWPRAGYVMRQWLMLKE